MVFDNFEIVKYDKDKEELNFKIYYPEEHMVKFHTAKIGGRPRKHRYGFKINDGYGNALCEVKFKVTNDLFTEIIVPEIKRRLDENEPIDKILLAMDDKYLVEQANVSRDVITSVLKVLEIDYDLYWRGELYEL